MQEFLTLDAAPQSYLTSEKKALTVDSFVKWRVSDVENISQLLVVMKKD